MAEYTKIKNVNVIICKDKQEVAKEAAGIFAKAIRKKPNIVLGLATGGTPVNLYKELIGMHKDKKLDFDRVVTFNLDEYQGLAGTHNQSYRCFMDSNLFNHVNVKKSNTHVPDGKAKDFETSCKKYEEDIKNTGGVELQLLGIGANGHIAFNEPGSRPDSRTRVVDLTQRTINDNARFFNDISEVPKKAITMGIATILEAKKIVLLATGENKKDAVVKSLENPASADVPASFLQNHPDCIFVIDKDAASGLTRKK